MWLKDYLSKHPLVDQFINNDADMAHLSINQEALLYIGSVFKNGKKLLIIKENENQAQKLVDEIRALSSDLRVVFYNQEESLHMETIQQSDLMKADRLLALYEIINDNFDICVTHAVASVRKIAQPKVLKDDILTLKVNQIVDHDALIKQLHRMGYSRVKYVEKPFTYASRGGIVDIYSIQEEHPIRLEFFDIELESIRSFDIATQRSIESLSEVQIAFANDIIMSESAKDIITKKVQNELQQLEDDVWIHNVENKLNILIDDMYDGSQYPLLAYWDEGASILDYFDDALVVLSPLETIHRNITGNEREYQGFIEEQIHMKEMIHTGNAFIDFNKALQNHPQKHIHEFQAEKEHYVPWHAAEIISDDIGSTLRWLKKEAITQKVLVALNSEIMGEFINAMIQADINYQIVDQMPTQNGIYVMYSDLQKGFSLSDEQLIVYTEFELYHYKRKVSRYDNKFSKAETIQTLTDLDIDDYVVHRQYGIGRYKGIETKEIENHLKDFMKIEYRDNHELFIPLEQFSLVRKYLSSHASGIKLSKLGSSAWQKNKDRIKADVADIADRLVNLYTSRSNTQGFAFSPDTEYQKAFEDEFPYDLTPDQTQAVKEIKEDMESSLPMDRLLIGDVGFGKTEVAIRAAFKALMDEKQVVFLCPTTILSAQHTRTLKERFKNYPITIEVLNRFNTPKQIKEIIERTKAGKVDILIGTHRVLSKDVKVKDLGLLIIDEEQRFGVEHKERIKEFKVSVDVLSLSATPIPRTLQMSLVGLRSLSQLNTPPSNRLPVMTYVIEKHQKTLFDIINKELARDGQVFYLYNNVQQLYNVATSIEMHVKDAKVAVVHGQMDRLEIEDVMLRFIAKEINTLVCTTIIETGIDIPNANTIIVDNAHRFGLSQLYQIKGRVGRSSRLAYAYFVVPEKMQLTEVAQKRLQSIKEFTQLGSGYKIAMRDLTIRGAGELLGGNQSGFIDSVGMELYVELLREAIAQRKGEPIANPEVINASPIKLDAYLPEGFTSDDGESLELYQLIERIDSFNGLLDFNEMILDRYGKLPLSVSMLLEKKRLELFLDDARVSQFKENPQGIELRFTKEYSGKVDGMKLFEVVSNTSSDIKIKYIDQEIRLNIPFYDEWVTDLIHILQNTDNHLLN